MKSPSKVQVFFAHQWPAKLWFGGWILGVAAPVIIGAFPGFATDPLSCAVVVIVSPVLGFFFGVVAGSLVLPPVYALRERLNGGPFKVGDSVQILVGPHRGRITTVVSPWQGRSYRVKLDDESAETFNDIFGADQLIKESDA